MSSKNIKQKNKNIHVQPINTRNYRYNLSANLDFIQENDVAYLITKNDSPQAVTLSSELFIKLLTEDYDVQRAFLLGYFAEMMRDGKIKPRSTYFERLDKFTKQLKKGGLAQKPTTFSELISLTNLAKKLKGDKSDIDLETFNSILVLIKGVVVKAMENLDIYKEVSEYVIPNSIVTVEIEDETETFFITNEPTLTDPMARIISSESPLGNALLGKSKNDEVHVEAPIGTLVYKITRII